MNGTGRKSENSGYLVILLLVVALTAFSHSMKELTEIFAPAQSHVTIVKVERVENCETIKQSAPAVELPWLNETPAAPNIDAIRINPRDREMILKTLNRSINLRIAS